MRPGSGWFPQKVGTLPPGAREVIFDCTAYTTRPLPDSGKVVVWSGTVAIPLEAARSVDDVLRPDRSSELTEAMRAALNVKLSFGYRVKSQPLVSAGTLMLSFDQTANPALSPVALGLAVDVLHDGKLAGTQRFRRQDFGPPDGRRFADATIYLPGVDDDAFGAAGAAEHWTLRVRGDGEMALTDWDRDQYWAGEFTLPLSDVLVR
jgi:hypothetical protein